MDQLGAFFIALAVIFVAEIGDKSQLMALAFASRFPPRVVLAAVSVAAFALHLLSVSVGAVLGTALPTRAISIAAAVAFFGFALWSLRPEDGGQGDDTEVPASAGRSVFLTVTGTFLLAELGDKTMLASVALAGSNGFLGTWLGASVAMIAADGLAIAAGHRIGVRLSRRTVARISAAMFAVFGALLLVDALR